MLIYTVDCELADEAAVLARHAGDRARAADARHALRVRRPARRPTSTPAAPRPVVVGFGPCGLFAALILAQMGLRPIVLERGKEVRERTKDTWGLWRQGVLNPESNVQFGEGGAGTFSDGKLYSQISDPRHLTRKVLTEFVKAGAPEEILYVSKPHIGTFRLVSMVEKMRADIEALGGEIRFEQRVDRHPHRRRPRGSHARRDARERRRAARRPRRAGRRPQRARHLRDAARARRLHGSQAVLDRLSHRAPAGLIDRARFGPSAGHPILGAADYKLVHHARNGRSVYSFCMCPGGTVVAATSEPRRVVTNGMSQYSRNERNANAGIVVGIEPQDYRQDEPRAGPVHPLDGIAFQRSWESRAYELGGGNYHAPGQLVGDFVAGRHGAACAREFGGVLPSYKPGVHLTDLADRAAAACPTTRSRRSARRCRPSSGRSRLRDARRGADRRGDAHLVADAHHRAARTSRASTCAGLYPAGEGAGYAGGIMSAAVDGIEVAEAVGVRVLKLVGWTAARQTEDGA